MTVYSGSDLWVELSAPVESEVTRGFWFIAMGGGTDNYLYLHLIACS